MATKDLLRPGYGPARTPKGRETMIPEGLTTQEADLFLSAADEVYDNDPDAQAREARNSRRQQRWDRQMAPVRAFRELEAKLLENDADAAAQPYDREIAWKEFRQGWRPLMSDKDRETLANRALTEATAALSRREDAADPF